MACIWNLINQVQETVRVERAKNYSHIVHLPLQTDPYLCHGKNIHLEASWTIP